MNDLIKKYVIVRSDRAGVFAGTLLEKEGNEVILGDVRRIWYWCGAASLSQLAVTGPMRAEDCKFSVVVSRILILGVIEIIPCTDVAQKVISEVKVWRV